jgi:hypothetical protein
MAAWLRVMIMAIRRTFERGRISWTPMIRFMASTTATNRLAESQSRAARPNVMIPAGGFSWSVASSRSTIEAASAGSRFYSRAMALAAAVAGGILLDPGENPGDAG